MDAADSKLSGLSVFFSVLFDPIGHLKSIWCPRVKSEK